MTKGNSNGRKMRTIPNKYSSTNAQSPKLVLKRFILRKKYIPIIKMLLQNTEEKNEKSVMRISVLFVF